MIKPLSIALALSLAAAGAAALAEDPGSTMSATPMQECIAKEKAKNDGRTDADISAACTAKMQKQQGPSSSPNDMAPSTSTPPSSSYPGTTTTDPSQEPK